jgi:hypothetical protein
VEFEVRVLISLRRPDLRSDSLVSVGVESRLVVRSCGQVLSPPMGLFVLVNSMAADCDLRRRCGQPCPLRRFV